jgi:hypothetical protein
MFGSGPVPSVHHFSDVPTGRYVCQVAGDLRSLKPSVAPLASAPSFNRCRGPFILRLPATVRHVSWFHVFRFPWQIASQAHAEGVEATAQRALNAIINRFIAASLLVAASLSNFTRAHSSGPMPEGSAGAWRMERIQVRNLPQCI